MPLRPLALLLFLALAHAGCGVLRPAAPAASDVPASAAVLVLINGADEPVRYVYLSPCEAGEWGPDRLQPDEVVMPGDSRLFALEPGCWDARVVFRDGREAAERGVEMTSQSQRTWTVLEPDDSGQ